MSWDATDPYQYNDYDPRPNYTEELVDYFFNRELTYIDIFKDYPWSPEFLEIDKKNKKIFFDWNTDTCNDLPFKGKALEDVCPNWKEQLFIILNDIIDSGHYKLSLYQHCFFIDKNKILRTFDFYGCIPKSNPFIEKARLLGMMGELSSNRFKEAEVGEYINFELIFKEAIRTHIKWPDDALSEFYKIRYA
jgi:hypothetical protein